MRRRFPGVVLVVILGLAIAVMFIPNPLNLRVTAISRSMEWALVDHPNGGPARIRFTYVDYPNYSEIIASDELADYLRRGGLNPVPGTLEVTKYWGRFEGYQIRTIGGLDQWNGVWITSSATTNGSDHGAPWEE
jgi:hypothetical protein